MWSKIPNLQGLRAAKNWLRDLAPDRQQRVQRNYDQGIRKIKAALAQDAGLLRTFQTVIEHAHFLGRVDGLREGLDLYEYGTRIQSNENSHAFRAIMNFIVRCAEKSEARPSAKEVCRHLDKEILRIKEQITSEVLIRPPDDWACGTWMAALTNKKSRSSVHKLISRARKEALSEQYCTLMAWKTWCRENKSKEHNGKESTRSRVQQPEAAPNLFG
ncbi:MAG: hypothetical protein WB460_09780 [Candidatus Acidiferrales bacterium]